MKHFLVLLAFGLCVAACDKKHEPAHDEHHEHASADSSTGPVKNKDACEKGFFIEDAYVYSNFITDNQAYIVEKNIDFVKTLESAESNEKTVEHYKALTAQTQQAIDSLENLCSFNGNTAYKESAVELFKFYQKAWGEYKNLVNITDKKERIKNYQAVKTLFHEKYSGTEKTLEEKFNKTHTDFANEYKLHVRSTPLHEKLDSLLYLK